MSGIEDKLDDLLHRAQAEVADVDLFAPLPPNEDCPICFLPYHREEGLTVFQTCCGKMICGGCASKSLFCAFCRAPTPRRLDRIKALEKHMQKQNPRAFIEMAGAYKIGKGVLRNDRKALELLIEAANLGYPEAYRAIAHNYLNGQIVTEDKSKSRAFLEVAAKKGSTMSHHKLAELNERMGNVGLAIKHHKVVACAGIRHSLTPLMKAFKDNLMSKKELEHCLRAFQISEDEMKSENRNAFLDLLIEQSRASRHL